MLSLTNDETEPSISYLTYIFRRREDGLSTLHQSKITGWGCYPDFEEFVADFLTRCRYPREQSHKYETYSWSPTLFEAEERVGEQAADRVTLCYLDLDNQHDDKPFITLEAIHGALKVLGVAHLLYTSYSHRPERHKVRVVMPVDRDITWDEAFLLFVWWNHAFGYQLDGSIYDAGDHLYGPTYAGEIIYHGGKALVVDDILADVLNLPDEALSYARREETKARGPGRPLTDAEAVSLREQMRDQTVSRVLDINDATLVTPEWLTLLDQRYVGGSHRQSLLGILTKVWLKSNRELTAGEMRQIQYDLDGRQGWYCMGKYGAAGLADDLKAVMKMTGSGLPPMTAEQARQNRMKADIKRLSRFRKI